MKKDNFYVLLRFYGGGGLAKFKIVYCSEEELDYALDEFENECIEENVGEFTAVLDYMELQNILNELI